MEIIEILGRGAQLRTNKPADDDPDTFEVIRLAALQYLGSVSAYFMPEQQSAADPEIIKQMADDVVRLTTEIYHNRDRAAVKANLPLWAIKDEGAA